MKVMGDRGNRASAQRTWACCRGPRHPPPLFSYLRTVSQREVNIYLI